MCLSDIIIRRIDDSLRFSIRPFDFIFHTYFVRISRHSFCLFGGSAFLLGAPSVCSYVISLNGDIWTFFRVFIVLLSLSSHLVIFHLFFVCVFLGFEKCGDGGLVWCGMQCIQVFDSM